MNRLYCCARTCVLFLLLASLGLRAHAQDRGDRYVIQVTPTETSCTYQIQDHVNQDLFVVRPGGLVRVDALRGLWVDIAIDDDPRGVPGTRNRRSMALRQQTPRDSLIVRGEVGRATEHRMRIQCCTSRARGQGCPRWVDAQPPQTETGNVHGGGVRHPEDGFPARGPMALAPPILPEMPPGGPVMRVEE